MHLLVYPYLIRVFDNHFRNADGAVRNLVQQFKQQFHSRMAHGGNSQRFIVFQFKISETKNAILILTGWVPPIYPKAAFLAVFDAMQPFVIR